MKLKSHQILKNQFSTIEINAKLNTKHSNEKKTHFNKSNTNQKMDFIFDKSLTLERNHNNKINDFKSKENQKSNKNLNNSKISNIN